MKIRFPDLKNFTLIVLAIAAILVTSFLIFVGYRATTGQFWVFSISLIAMFCGLIFESLRISDNWSTVAYIFVGALIFSLFTFLPGKNESNYYFEDHLAVWPYFFLFWFSLGSAFFHSDKTTAKLTEGITLLQSISLIYWIIDYGFINVDSLFVKSLIVVALIFSAFSIFNSLTPLSLSRTNRLLLSIWSSVVMMLYGIDNIYNLYRYDGVDAPKYLTTGLFTGLQFFLLGVSSIYIVQNILMLIRFLPGKATFFNGQYFEDLRELKSEHIKRYSDRQVHIGHSAICIMVSSALYFFNFKYQYLPRPVMIWIVFFLFPVFIQVFERKATRIYR